MDEGSSDSGEDRVIVDYTTLTRKDVEISPKQQKPPPRVVKPTHLLAAAKRITPHTSSSEHKAIHITFDTSWPWIP